MENPLLNAVTENGKITIASVFQFSGGYVQFESFIRECAKKNCTVYFENEDMTITPTDNSSRMVANIYLLIAENTKLKRDFMSYLSKLSAGEYRSDGIQIL